MISRRFMLARVLASFVVAMCPWKSLRPVIQPPELPEKPPKPKPELPLVGFTEVWRTFRNGEIEREQWFEFTSFDSILHAPLLQEFLRQRPAPMYGMPDSTIRQVISQVITEDTFGKRLTVKRVILHRRPEVFPPPGAQAL